MSSFHAIPNAMKIKEWNGMMFASYPSPHQKLFFLTKQNNLVWLYSTTFIRFVSRLCQILLDKIKIINGFKRDDQQTQLICHPK